MQKPSKEQDILFNKVRCTLDHIHEHIKRRYPKDTQQSYVKLALAALARFEMLIDLTWGTISTQLKRKLSTAIDDWAFAFLCKKWKTASTNIFTTKVAPLQEILVTHAQTHSDTIERGLSIIHDTIPTIYLPRREAVSVKDLNVSKGS